MLGVCFFVGFFVRGCLEKDQLGGLGISWYRGSFIVVGPVPEVVGVVMPGGTARPGPAGESCVPETSLAGLADGPIGVVLGSSRGIVGAVRA